MASTITPLRPSTPTPELVETIMVAAEVPAEKRKRPIRTALFWLHLASGVAAGVVVFIMSLTGVFVAYERQMQEWSAHRHVVAAPAGPAAGDATRMPLDSLLAHVNALPAAYRVTSLTLRPDHAAPVTFGLENRTSIFVDPYTGKVLGDDTGVRGFTNWALRLHRSLALGPTTRDPLGAQITGASNLLFLFMILSGLVLWWPKRMSKRAFRAVTFFSGKARGRARDWNWHHVLGIWSAIPLVLIVASAAFISYRWPQTLLEKATGSAPGAPRGEGRPAGGEGRREAGGERRGGGERGGAARGGGGAPQGALLVPATDVSLEAVAVQAASNVEGWRSLAIRAAREPGGVPTVTANVGPHNRPSDRVQLTIENVNGTYLARRTPPPREAAARIRAWMRPIHTGEALGTVGQTIAALASAAAVVLAFTGLALTWRRFLRSVRRTLELSPRPS